MTCAPSEDRSTWVAKDPSFLHADSKDSDQIGRLRVFAGRTVTLLVLSWGGSHVVCLTINWVHDTTVLKSRTKTKNPLNLPISIWSVASSVEHQTLYNFCRSPTRLIFFAHKIICRATNWEKVKKSQVLFVLAKTLLNYLQYRISTKKSMPSIFIFRYLLYCSFMVPTILWYRRF